MLKRCVGALRCPIKVRGGSAEDFYVNTKPRSFASRPGDLDLRDPIWLSRGEGARVGAAQRAFDGVHGPCREPAHSSVAANGRNDFKRKGILISCQSRNKRSKEWQQIGRGFDPLVVTRPQVPNKVANQLPVMPIPPKVVILLRKRSFKMSQ